MRQLTYENCLLVLLVIIHFYEIFAQYRFPVHKVSSCPETKTSWNKAGLRLNCSTDRHSRLQYQCIPTQDISALVEFCYDLDMGFYEKGKCLHLSSSGFLHQRSCETFTDGCPPQPYFSSDMFQYPKCSEIDEKNRCYIADIDCQSRKSVKGPFTIGARAEATKYSTVLTDSSTTLWTYPGVYKGNTTTTFEKKNCTCRNYFHTDNPSQMKIIIILSAMLSTMMLMNILIVFVFCIKKRKIFERCKRYKPIPNKNIEIGLDPKIEYFTKVYQFRNNLRLKCGNESEKVIWKKNDEEINVEGHVNKYKTDKHGNLFIFDVKMEDKGRYQCFAPEGHADTYAVNIEIQTLKLNGPMDILQDEDLSRNAEKYVCIIWNGDKDRDVNSIVEITEISRPSMYPGDASGLQGLFPESNKQAELKFLFHCCVLLSKNFTLKWGEINENHLDRINQLLQSTLRLNINDYRESAVKQETLISSEGSITFASEEAKIQTFWTLLQRCHVPKRLIDYVFDNKLANLIIRFLRLDGHKCSDSETCIVLSSLHVEKYLEFLISKHFTGKDESDMEENSVLKKIIIDDEYMQEKDGTIKDFVITYAFKYKEYTKSFVSKYFRSQGYKAESGESCICLSEKETENLIKTLNIDIIVHPTISDEHIHLEVSKQCKIPLEVLKWSHQERIRFLNKIKLESTEVFHARGMLIGCAGAGKTTLLGELRRKKLGKRRQNTKTTIGLEVHNDLFVVENNTLLEYDKGKDDASNSSRNLISITDFAGQVAYYACHQVYLSRRAFYILVVDMTKDLESTLPTTNRSDMRGSLFENWTYKKFFRFWLQSIHTYCDEREDFILPEKRNKDLSPLLLVATHADKIQESHCICPGSHTNKEAKGDLFYDSLIECIPGDQSLLGHLSFDNYFEVGFPPRMPWAKNKDIEKIRKAIVDTVEELSHWGERIPKVWNDCEKFLKENQKKQIISRNDVTMFFRNNYPETEKDINVDDILKFYHEVGLILHFPNESLKDVIIVDVQWFVHAFKHIITDPKHFDKHCGNKNEFKSFNDFGILSDTLLQKIWTYNNKTTKSCIQHKSKIIPYMNKLGLIAQIDYESANQTDAEKSEIVDEVKYYIPSMNKMNFDLSSISKIMSGQRTSILHFKFTDFIPHFFFYRLIVACIGKWKLLDKGKRLFKDIAFYITDGQGYHNIAIAINESCIQVQMFRRDNRELEIEHTLSCREMIEEMIGRITSTFHKSVKYVTGFSCKDINLTEESEENFLEERDIINLVHEFACPNHVDKNHQVDGAKLL